MTRAEGEVVMLTNMRGTEWIILLLIVLLLFGARRLPDLARSVGRSMKIFKKEVAADDDKPVEDEPYDPRTDDGGKPTP
jgi:sec-independent protein translocase protein TatA